MKILIIDGYVDEPSCLGVPPYISVYPRYIYGLLKSFNFSVDYKTIDELRINGANIFEKFGHKKSFQSDIFFQPEKSFQNDKIRPNQPSTLSTDNGLDLKTYNYVIIIGGLSVPGKYLSSHPITLNEITSILSYFKDAKFVLAGSLSRGWTIEGGKKPVALDYSKFSLVTNDNYLKQIFEYFIGRSSQQKINFDKESFAVIGAECVVSHHKYPNIICEIETYSGCLRSVKCSFCVEQFGTLKSSRNPENIINEIAELNKFGIVHFRIGNQPDIFGYGSSRENYKPNPQIIEELFYGIREKITNISTLHTDNANPAIISQYPEESKKVIKSLVKYCSGGNVLALGCETFDKTVCAINNLNSFPEQSFDAIKIINEIGNVISENGMPKLLPGINLLFGLAGETGDTWKCNYDFLSKILDSNLLLRRINIRQAIKFDGSYISEISSKPPPKLKYEFEQYKKMIRKDIDNEMLKKIAPVGRVLKNLFIEKKDKYLSFARQFGAYPIIVGTAENLEFEKFFDMIIVNHGYRSVTGLLYPVNINTIKYESLKTISGVNKDIANRIIYKRPFSDINDFFKNIPEHITPVFNSLTEHITFN